MRKFSQELIDRILDYVATFGYQEVNTNWYSDEMAACGLVCRKWATRSRFWLFHELYFFGSNDDLGRWLDVAETSSTIPLFPIVRGLRLQFAHRKSFKREHLARLLQDCVNLTSISIVTVPWESRDPDCPQELDPYKTRYDTTRISYHEFLETNLSMRCDSLTSFGWSPNEEDAWGRPLGKTRVSLGMIAHIFDCLPNLEVFAMGEAITISPHEGPLPPSSIPARLHSLDLKEVEHTHILFNWFLSLPVLPVFKSLKFQSSDEQDWVSLHAYSQLAGQALEALDICSDHGEPPAILRYATMIRNLHLRTESTAHMLAALSTLTSHNLQVIEITVNRASSESDPMPYGLIEKALATPKFRGLKRFVISDWRGPYPPPTEEIAVLMPLTHARGILDFVYEDWA